MGKPLFLIENFFNEVMFPGHQLVASSEAAGGEAWRVGTGRRRPDDRWAPSTTNTSAWLRVDCRDDAGVFVIRSADTLVIDRSHNLTGRRLRLQASNDLFAADVRTVLDVTLPLSAVPGTSIDAAAGCLTEEGAWVKRFAAAEGFSFRLLFDALGVDVRPEVMGAWLGRSWQPELYFDLPWSDDGLQVQYSPSTSPSAWTGIGRSASPRAGQIGIKLRTEAEYILARYHLRELWWRTPRPGWLILDDAAAERAVLAVPPPGEYSFAQEEGWARRQAHVGWIEHEPAPR